MGRLATRAPSQQHSGLLQILQGTTGLCLQHVCRYFLYTHACFCFILKLFLQSSHEFWPKFFQKIIGDMLIIRHFTGNNFIVILFSPYRFLLYHLPCSLYFSVGNWFCEGALYHSHWLWIEFSVLLWAKGFIIANVWRS